MAWFKVDDNLSTHLKVVIAGNEAMGLWVRAGSWAAQHMTDGYVPIEVVQLFGADERLADKLVSAGLWHEKDGGYEFNDWLEFQPSREKVISEREAGRERVAKAREKAAEQRTGVRSTVSRATRIPSDFHVTSDMRSWAAEKCPGINVDKSTEQFIDYWKSKGSNATKTDWVATWRNWIRRELEWAKPTPEVEQEDAMAKWRAERAERIQRQQEQAAEREAAKDRFTPPPKCKHGKTIVTCLPCAKELAKVESA